MRRNTVVLLVFASAGAALSATATVSCVGDEPAPAPVIIADGGGGEGDGSGGGSIDGTTGADTSTPTDSGNGGTDGTTVDTGADAFVPLTIHPSVGVGDGFACALRPTGKVYCWGDARCGAVGGGSSEPSYAPPNFTNPAQVAGITPGNPAALLSVGRLHACVVLADRTVACWGQNETNQLGHSNATGDATGVFCPNGSIQYKASATPVAGLSDVIELSAGFYHTCVRKSDKTVYCWGGNESDELGYANTADGTCFGGTQCNPSPSLVKNGANALLADQIATGASHTCARTGTTALCWGYNQYAQLGHTKGSNGDLTLTVGASNPTPIAPVNATGIVGLFAGGYNTCMVDGAQKVSCWGDNGGPGELPGFANPTSADPVLIPGVPAAVSFVSASYGSACALWGNFVSCWGENSFGQSGQADAGSPEALPNQINGFTNPIDVSGKYYARCALTSGGSVYCWGLNTNGEAGHDNSTDVSCGTGCKYNPNPIVVANLP
jgi:alpha-tubulin suppressor-like RCC1 family protein